MNSKSLKMRRFQGPFFTIAISLSLLAGVFVVHRLLEPSRTCVNWEGIRELSFRGQAIPACASINRLQRPIAKEPVLEWADRLNRLDRLEWVKAASTPVSIHIDEKNPNVFQTENQLVTIGFALAEKPGQLEHATLLGWVQTNWPEQDLTTQEVMADILTWTVMGDSTWTDPTTNKTVSPSTYLRFSLMPASQANYCRSPFRSLLDLEACDLNEEGEVTGPQTLRPLVSWTIWNFVKELSFPQQIGFFEALLKTHGFIESDPEELSIDRREWTKTKAIALIGHWKLNVAANSQVLTKTLHALDLNSPLAFDLTVEVNDLNLQDRVLGSLRPWSAFYPNMRVLFVSGQRKIVLPEGVSVDFSPQEVETRRYVMVACGWPKPKESFALKNHAFFAFQVCGSEKLPSWTEITHPKLPPLGTRLGAGL